MGEILIDVEVKPATPAAGKIILFPETVGKRLSFLDDAGRSYTIPGAVRNWNTADVTANAADTYVTGSGLTVPTGLLLQVGVTCEWNIFMTKTAAGVASPVWNIRVGINGSTADTARCVFTQVAAQTGAADAGWVKIIAILRNIGAAGVLGAGLTMNHVLAATGFSTLTENVQQVTSAGFDTTVANTIVGLSVNPGAAGVWTLQVVSAEMKNI